MASLSLVPTPSVAATSSGSLKAAGLEIEQATEAAEAADHARTLGRAPRAGDRLDQGVAGIDIDAGVAIGD